MIDHCWYSCVMLLCFLYFEKCRSDNGIWIGRVEKLLSLMIKHGDCCAELSHGSDSGFNFLQKQFNLFLKQSFQELIYYKDG